MLQYSLEDGNNGTHEQYHLLDGGVYDNPDITIQRAMDMVNYRFERTEVFSSHRAVLSR